MRSGEKPVLATCVKGIHQMEEYAGPEYCSDARNVWSVNGKVETRPGVLGVGVPGYSGQATSLALTGETVIKETPIGTFDNTVTLSNLPVGDRFYYGFDNLPDAEDYPSGITISVTTANSNLMRFFMEYWNGTEWVYLPAEYTTSDQAPYLIAPSFTFLQAQAFTAFVWPADFAQTTIAYTLPAPGSATKYFLRFTLVALNGSTAFDASTVIATTAVAGLTDQTIATFLGLVGNTKAKIYFSLANYPTAPEAIVGLLSRRIDVGESSADSVIVDNFQLSPKSLFSSAIVSETEWYLANGRVHFIDPSKPGTSAAANKLIPQVEDREFAVGENAPYDNDYIGQRTAFPSANFISYQGSRLWMADDNKIMWSAATPFHRVLPLLSEEPVGPGDEGKITGLSELGEYTYVFKQRGIYRMVFESLNAFGLSVFRPIKVADIGTVSNASIKKIGNKLIFLAEQGLMSFDGQTVKLVSLDSANNDRLVNFFTTLPHGKWAFAAAANWRSQRVYLLSLAMDGSDVPNKILVWDYEDDAFWIWEGFEAQHWVEDADGRVYFADSRGRVFELGNGQTDHGAAIESYVVSSYFELANFSSKAARDISVLSSNVSQACEVSVLHDDVVTPLVTGTGTISFTDYTEAVYDEAVYDESSYTEIRKRARHIGVLVPGQRFKVKVAHSTKGVPFEMTALMLSLNNMGQRR